MEFLLPEIITRILSDFDQAKRDRRIGEISCNFNVSTLGKAPGFCF